MSEALQKVGLPSHLAEGARLAKKIQQIQDQRGAAIVRIEAEFRARIKAAVEDFASESTAAATSEVTPQQAQPEAAPPPS
jgi:hypothetical protein